ncbi:pseudouridine synthase [Basidiobolus meristosporus CBS 931.73]|uniref:Pseudouridine synthase n=1 Tax=Basidiobolus meristosporus CBS 931.73 TaxID=1314790 RepID=A0A1Y1YTM1_9FUNG|nr:pseudouridine synthase [Basidiobolus meristosporus CBS 931.73]|eukprot:ORY00915.1 pseudouridine synthase [Basidiobolus meristosporus CBS 931.73]
MEHSIGLRKIKPYFFKHQTFAKGRWVGKSILDAFSQEFRDRTPEYYRKAIEEGRITINQEKVQPSTRIGENAFISHYSHRHEPAITAAPIKIIEQDENILVVDKPASIPVHPTGRYSLNTLINILKKEKGFSNLYPVNRLDRLTSGIVILALTKGKAQELEALMHDRKMSKEYVCQVTGEFPKEEITVTERIETVSHKLGLNIVSPKGKECKTTFERMHYNGKTSLVRCKPETGRTHQIRVHLQYLGYPIANDPVYADESIWGPELGKGGVSKEQLEQVLAKLEEKGSEEDSSGKLQKCPDCDFFESEDPKPEELCIWLHALKYQCQDWTYETEMPAWAHELNGDI